jgi:hypothetical protein
VEGVSDAGFGVAIKNAIGVKDAFPQIFSKSREDF